LNRVIARQAIFATKAKYVLFEQVLSEAIKRDEMRLLASSSSGMPLA
jgi:hypothetical protein